MKDLFKNAHWIWCNSNPQPDEYAEFVDQFVYEKGRVLLRISADSNYAVYINGQLAVWGQYADFPYDKVYDEVDVTNYCCDGTNRISTRVWYYGIDSTQVYYPGNAGLIYELICENEILCQTNKQTLSRMSKSYLNHRMSIITGQLGLSYGYDASKEDCWLTEDTDGFSHSFIVDQNLLLRIRPCDKLTLLPEKIGTECKRITDKDVIFDLGNEQVGFLSFQLFSSCEQNITISYGEHLVDGSVRRLIDKRDFSVFYRTKKGENLFLNPFRRLGCRYLQVHSEYPVTIHKIAIAPTMYLLEEKKRPVLNTKQAKIYDMCIETLRLCMHEHYEDCPWREQALYTMDSRNQMLCGYYAFGEYKFPRSNLQLISKDDRKDGLLAICYPMKFDFAIPSFSLHYITACKEYLEYSGDMFFLEEIYPKLLSILKTFTNHMENGLVLPFSGDRYWNFYEWRDGLDGSNNPLAPDLILNSLLSIALQNMAFISNALGKENNFNDQAIALNLCIFNTFWSKKDKVFYNFPDHKTYSQLGNSLGILCGAIDYNMANSLCERLLTDKEMTPISLSMQCFKYDALLKINKKLFAPIILKDIENIYTPMIDFGSTTVWETELGESDFDNAGSLCHGWSAFPIYYYHILLS